MFTATNSSPARHAGAAFGPQAGLTLLELMLTLAVLTLGIGALARLTLGTARAAQAARENQLACSAARAVLERIQAESFPQAFRSFNSTPDDDPGGPGTAPGAGFAVPGLRARPGDADGLPGQILLPADPSNVRVLREDLPLPALGMPLDLDGNGSIDPADHATDYKLLPVLVRVEWQSADGTAAHVELRTMLASY